MAQHRHKRETNARRLLRAGLRRPAAVNLVGPLAVLATAGALCLGAVGTEVAPAPVAAAPVAADLGDLVAGDAAEVVERLPSLSRGGFDPRGGDVEPDGGDVEPDGADVTPVSPANRALLADPAPSPARSSLPARAKVRTTTPAPPTALELLLAPAATRNAVRGATLRRYTTATLNLWSRPGDRATLTGQVASGEKVLITGRSFDGRVEIVWQQSGTRWVTAGYLSDDEPAASGGTCTNGTSVPSGVSNNIKLVHAAVCAAFPEISIYGTFRGDGEHSQGIAVDIMVSGGRGQQVADFVRAHFADLGVSYVIYSQHIWSVQRSGEGWRSMSDRGSVTANHYDHVHVTTY